MDTYYDWKQRIANHDYIIEGALTHPFESVHLGSHTSATKTGFGLGYGPKAKRRGSH